MITIRSSSHGNPIYITQFSFFWPPIVVCLVTSQQFWICRKKLDKKTEKVRGDQQFEKCFATAVSASNLESVCNGNAQMKPCVLFFLSPHQRYTRRCSGNHFVLFHIKCDASKINVKLLLFNFFRTSLFLLRYPFTFLTTTQRGRFTSKKSQRKNHLIQPF